MRGPFPSLPAADRGGHEEGLASKALMSIAMFYLGDIDEKVRSDNVRAIVMEFIKRKAR
jgi:hypothetical protein